MAKLKWLLLGVVAAVVLAGVAYRVFNTVATGALATAGCPAANVATFTPPPPVTAADYLALGDYDYDRGNCDQAILDYGRAIALNPRSAEAYNNRAYTYMLGQNYAAALTDLDTAIALRPDYVNALMNRGDIYNYYYQINFDKAIADYNRVIAIDPAHTSVCGHLALAKNHGWNFGTLVTFAGQTPQMIKGSGAAC